MDDLFGDVVAAPQASTSASTAAAAVHDDYESVLFVARECYVYKLPPRQSTAGYKAAEWGDMEAFLWKGQQTDYAGPGNLDTTFPAPLNRRFLERLTGPLTLRDTGRCRVMEITSGDASNVTVQLEDSNSGELFAQCPYDKTGKAVEPVLDSSRYFVLKVVDVASGKHAYLGMGFQERTEAFDFQVALQDWQKRQRAAKLDAASQSNGPVQSPHIPPGPKRDFSLKEGQTISVKLGGVGGPTKKSSSANRSETAGSGGGIPLLAPPPPAGRNR